MCMRRAVCMIVEGVRTPSYVLVNQDAHYRRVSIYLGDQNCHAADNEVCWKQSRLDRTVRSAKRMRFFNTFPRLVPSWLSPSCKVRHFKCQFLRAVTLIAAEDGAAACFAYARIAICNYRRNVR